MRRVAFLALLMAAASAPTVAQTPPTPAFVDMVRRSGFIFEGTIRQIGASTPSVPTQPNTAVVVVDKVIEALPPIRNPRGDKVTVRLQNPKHFHQHQKATFFTFIYTAGTTLGLDVVGTLGPDTHHRIAQDVREARQIIADQDLSARLSTAQAVVVGVISGPLPPDLPRPPSEHDPRFRRRAIQTESIEKGTPPTPPIVFVSESTDVAWELAPKPAAGTRAIFLLQPTAPMPQFTTAPGPFLVQPLDVLPRTELDRVRRLLRSRP